MSFEIVEDDLAKETRNNSQKEQHTFGVWALTFPARANEPWTLPKQLTLCETKWNSEHQLAALALAMSDIELIHDSYIPYKYSG